MDGTDVKEISADIRAAALDYVSPKGPRRVVRRPKTDAVSDSKSIDYNNGHLSIRSWGEGNPVLLVHGWAANQTDMFAFVPPLVERGYKAIAMDLPSHGESSGDYAGLDHLAEGIRAAGENIGPLEAVVAHSAGCAAAQLAISNGMRVEKAVMLASPTNYEINAYRHAQALGYDDQQTQEFIQALADLDVRVAIKSVDFVPSFKLSALIIHSEDDAVIPISRGEELAGIWKDSQFVRVNGLNHRGVLKDTSVVSAVVEFIAR